MLKPEDFPSFFKEVHGYNPFPWQHRLLDRLARQHGRWPAILNLPTGAGKTTAIDIAVFHLALEADRGPTRRAPVRIALVVDRRLVVDDAYAHARKLEMALVQPRGPITARVAERLKALSGEDRALVVRRLRGGVPREDDWARTPSQPTVLCSTVDQVGSRLLFRGYGVSDTMKPLHAGLLGSDCLILLDEAHLAEPFRQTLEWVSLYRGERWREVDDASPFGITLMTATPVHQEAEVFSLDDDDRAHPVLNRRLSASKLAHLIVSAKSTHHPPDSPDSDHARANARGELRLRAETLVNALREALKHFRKPEHGATAPAIGVVANRVGRAREVLKQVELAFRTEIENSTIAKPILMIGPARSIDRDHIAGELAPIRTKVWSPGERRALDRPIILIATQCIEVGLDIDLDALITELAPLDALRQRFGRLNRSGREITPWAAIVATKSELSTRYVDPIYGTALKATWDVLEATSAECGLKQQVDFGLDAFSVPVAEEALAPRLDAPVLLPAHLDLLCQTSPIPQADPELALFLHGPERDPDSVSVVWRSDVDHRYQDDETVRRLLSLLPPRSAEAVELPLWAVRRWLTRTARAAIGSDMADVAGNQADLEPSHHRSEDEVSVFRWRGDDERSRWIDPSELRRDSASIRPGDTIVVPATYGGLDEFGWDPTSEGHVADVADRAAREFAGRRLVVRVAPGLVGDPKLEDAIADALASSVSRRWQDLRAALLPLPLPEQVREDLTALDRAKAGRVVAYLDLYGHDARDRPRGVVFVAMFGITGVASGEDGLPSPTEDDTAGSMPGFSLKLDDHSRDVGDLAREFARLAGLPEARVLDLALAGELHDLGKADRRFQAWLYHGDPLGPDPDHALAKSARRLPRSARGESGLPPRWRHEALSVRRALSDTRLNEANDPELVLWLIGTHHGYGRPLFPHCDPEEQAPDVGPQSLAFDWRGLDWPSLFTRLRNRYGIWELARMEAIVRLADHRASEARTLEVSGR